MRFVDNLPVDVESLEVDASWSGDASPECESIFEAHVPAGCAFEFDDSAGELGCGLEASDDSVHEWEEVIFALGCDEHVGVGAHDVGPDGDDFDLAGLSHVASVAVDFSEFVAFEGFDLVGAGDPGLGASVFDPFECEACALVVVLQLAHFV